MSQSSEPTRLDPPSRWGSRLRMIAFRAIRISLLVYLGVFLVLSAMQSRLIFPGQVSQGTPLADVRPRPGVDRIEMVAASGERVVALFGPALHADGSLRDDAGQQPTLLFFYGNGDCLAAFADQLDVFRRLGLNVMIPEYLGYGLSEGTASEAGFYATADAALAHLQSRSDVDPHKIIVGGWSIGSGVAIDLAHRVPLAGLAAFSAFTSMGELVHKFYPIPGLGLALKHRFENLRKIRDIRCPTLIGHGEDDLLIPISMSGQLAEAAGGPVRSFRVRAGHNDFFANGTDRIAEAFGWLINQVAFANDGARGGDNP